MSQLPWALLVIAGATGVGGGSVNAVQYWHTPTRWVWIGVTIIGVLLHWLAVEGVRRGWWRGV